MQNFFANIPGYVCDHAFCGVNVQFLKEATKMIMNDDIHDYWMIESHQTIINQTCESNNSLIVFYPLRAMCRVYIEALGQVNTVTASEFSFQKRPI